jgi:hypothetical protein
MQLGAVCCLIALVLAGLARHASASGDAAAPLPPQLTETGLYVPGSTTAVRAENRPFSPQYALWSDGASKRRWLHLPAGTHIDASRPDAWEFPRGTRLWKEFSHGRRIETRFIERLPDGSWRYATYVWNEAGTQALLAPAEGVELLVVGAPSGRYAIPSEADCRACHEGAAVPVLGVSALQLSPDRDPLAPHAEARTEGDVDLDTLLSRGWVRKLPDALRERAPRIGAESPLARAALGYLHGNCGHCHNDTGAPPPVDLVLAHAVSTDARSHDKVVRSLVGVLSRYRAPGTRTRASLVDAGRPETSVLAARMRSRDPRMQMPPLGTRIVDLEALDLIERWIENQPAKELHP